jgi:hypothetical protein
MANKHKLPPVMKIYSAQILEVIKQDNFLDVSKLTFDSDRNMILYNNKPLELKKESMRFKVTYPEYSFSFREFGDILWYMAKVNTPEEDERPDPLEEKIVPWLIEHAITNTKTLTIVEQCLQIKDASKGISCRSLCIRIAAILRKHGFKKKHNHYGKVWIKLEPLTAQISSD